MIWECVAAEHTSHHLGLNAFLRQASHCGRQLRMQIVAFESIERDQYQFGCLPVDAQGQANQQNKLEKQL